ncbi:MAG: 30S ribosome-binding factor RbfA [Clostridia bacterium]|nr:30S ribosome-binding factor RbfA [Clostridia bacterium]
MSGYRMDRTGEDIMRELTAILRTVKDPRVSGLISIVRADVTRDMSYATVYISSMDGIEAAKNAVKGLTSAAGYMRRELGAALKLRHVPELRFVADDSIAYSSHIAQTLRGLTTEEDHE